MGFRPGETVFMMTGYGPHVWAWGVQYALEKMELPTIPGGGMDAQGACQYRPALQADHSAVHALLCAASRPADAVDGARSGSHQRAHAVSGRRAGAGGRIDTAPHRRSLERPHRRILRLHRSVATCRRLFVSGAAARHVAGGDALDGRHPDLGGGRSGNAARRLPAGSAA